jgi:hypothetical protein
MPNLITDLFEYDTESIIDFMVHPSGLKDGTVDHAVHVPLGRTTSGQASVYLQTSQFENGVTSISILEQLHPTAASDIAKALRQSAATAKEDVSLEEIVHASTTAFVKAKVEQARKSVAGKARLEVRFAVAKLRTEKRAKELMEDLEKDLRENPEGNPSN